MAYNPFYKCSGSAIMWLLHNKAVRAFMVWMLAQKYDRKRNRRPTGLVDNRERFLSYLMSVMGCSKRTAKKRVNEAIRWHMIWWEGRGWSICSHRRLTVIIMDDCERIADDMEVAGLDWIDPEVYFKSDRKFTRKFEHWVSPRSVQKTIDLLSGIAIVQNSVANRSKLNQARLLNCHRSTIQRRSKRAEIKEIGRYIVINPKTLLDNASCSNVDAINAFTEAEVKYRETNYMSGRRMLHQKYVNGRKRLVIQLPNTCYDPKNEREMPSIREAASWLHLKAGTVGRGTVTTETKLKHEMASRLVEWPDRFVESKDVSRVEAPPSLLNRYFSVLKQIFEDKDCRSHVLKKTGAKDLINPRFSQHFVFNATPNKRRGFLDLPISSSSENS